MGIFKKKTSKFNKTDLSSHLLLILFGISSFKPRRHNKGSNHIYFSEKNVKNLCSLSFNEKIRQILLWKKTFQKNQGKNFLHFRKNINLNIPVYSMDELILGKYPNFSKAFQEFFKFIPVFFMLIFKIQLIYQNNKITGSFSIFINHLNFFFCNFVKLKGIVVLNDTFQLELEMRKRNIMVTFSKNYLNINISEGGTLLKILIDFHLQLARSVMTKIIFFHECKSLGGYFYRLDNFSEVWLNSPNRYYRTGQTKYTTFFNKSNQQSDYIKIIVDKQTKNKLKPFNIFNFSRNLMDYFSKIKIRGFFFDEINYEPKFFNRTVFFLLRPLFCRKKNETEIRFHFLKKISKKCSILSETLFFNIILDLINLKIDLPILPYVRVNQTKSVNGKSRKLELANKKHSLNRISRDFQNFFYDLLENSFYYDLFSLYIYKKDKILSHEVSIFNRFSINICFFIK